jgi:GNAT superfamily N-acetyltransferase
VVVAEAGNKIIASGYARIDRSRPFLRHSSHAYLGFMYVLPEYRGQGINKRIIDALKIGPLFKTLLNSVWKFIMIMFLLLKLMRRSAFQDIFLE